MTIKDTIQKKSLEGVHRYIWTLAGTFSVITLTLMFNGINAGRHIDDLIDIYVEEKRARISTSESFKKTVENHNIIIASFKAELKALKKQVKINTELAHKAHR